MANDPDKQLERLIHDTLRELPEMPAPADLTARVRARIDAQAHLPWWQQPWMTWPLAARVSSALVLLTGIGYAAWLADSHVPGVGRSLDGVEQKLGNWAWVWDLASTLGNAFMAVLASLDTNYWLIVVAVLVASYVSCVGLGTLCFRLAYSKR